MVSVYVGLRAMRDVGSGCHGGGALEMGVGGGGEVFVGEGGGVALRA